MFGLDRSRTASRWLPWKVRLFTAGAVLAVVGMAREETWMITAAILVLLAGFALRFLPGVEPEEEAGEEDDRGSASDAVFRAGPPPADDRGP